MSLVSTPNVPSDFNTNWRRWNQDGDLIIRAPDYEGGARYFRVNGNDISKYSHSLSIALLPSVIESEDEPSFSCYNVPIAYVQDHADDLELVLECFHYDL